MPFFVILQHCREWVCSLHSHNLLQTVLYVYNVLISWPVNVGDVFIVAWLLVWLARPICQRLCRTLCTLTPGKLSAVSYDPLTHSRHNAGDRSVKVGHEIKVENSFFMMHTPKRDTETHPCFGDLLRHIFECTGSLTMSTDVSKLVYLVWFL